MLDKIKKAQAKGRILPDMVIDYENVKIHNSIEIIATLYDKMRQILDNNKFSYVIQGYEGMKSININYLEDFEPDYYIVRISTHDGTLMFTRDLFYEVIKDVVMGSSYCKENVPNDYKDNIWSYGLDYTIGNIYNFKDYGLKEISGAKMYGMTEVMIMPIKINYIKY